MGSAQEPVTPNLFAFNHLASITTSTPPITLRTRAMTNGDATHASSARRGVMPEATHMSGWTTFVQKGSEKEMEGWV